MLRQSILLLVFAAAGTAAEPQVPRDIEPEQLRPGLLAEYQSLSDPSARLNRIDAKPSFYIAGSSPHPRLPPGPFAVIWKGLLHIQDAGPIRFGALAGGEVRVVVDGITVINGRGKTTTDRVAGGDALTRDAGYYPIIIRFRSFAGAPARLQLHWEAPSFAREPVPAWRFKHLHADQTAAWKTDDTIARGRSLAGQLGCARCHAKAMPGVGEPPPGPDLTGLAKRVSRDWLMGWLANPRHVRPDARMPALFADDAEGRLERWLIATHYSMAGERETQAATGDHRAGRLAFHSLGCATCHFVPESDRNEQKDLDRTPLTGLADRYQANELAGFLRNPHRRYPDARMPSLQVTEKEAANIAAYLLLWSKPSDTPKEPAPSGNEIQRVLRRLGADDTASAAKSLVVQKGCAACHTGLEKNALPHKPITDFTAGCLRGKSLPHFNLDSAERSALAAFLRIAAKESHSSPFFERQRLLHRAGCVRCHQRDSDLPPPMESIGSTLGGAFLQSVPFQRTPRLTFPHQKYTRAHLAASIRDGLPTLRSKRYTYRMPAYGEQAAVLLRALAEADGEIPDANDSPDATVADPTIGTVAGPQLVGAQGYSCVSCHVWNGQLLVATDPGAVGPDLTRTAGRIRREWFERFLDNPLRYHPGTPMPTVFERGKAAPLRSVFDGDAVKQKEALWCYFAQGKSAPGPKPPPPVPIAPPAAGEPATVAQIPIHLPDGSIIESICILTENHDLLVYDLATFSPVRFYSGGQILRTVQGRIRQFLVGAPDAGLDLSVESKRKPRWKEEFHSYRRLVDGVQIDRKAYIGTTPTKVDEKLQVSAVKTGRRLIRRLTFDGVPSGQRIEFTLPKSASATSDVGTLDIERGGSSQRIVLTAGANRTASVTISYPLPPVQRVEPYRAKAIVDDGPIEGSLERPGYRAVMYARPKTAAGEDRVMPGAVAVDPRDGRVFVASLKTGELFVLRNPANATQARFDNYARGLFQDALSMLAEDDGVYVLHRRNLSKLTDADRDGLAERIERVAALPQGVADTYDYAYGLVHDRRGFVLSYAPYADGKLVGAGGAIRLSPGKPPEEIAFGMRNPVGWCAGPEREIFFTDNQGEWVAANKLCHVVSGRYYGFPNRAQPQHTKKPFGKTTIWVPYAWARSINGVAYDNTKGKFGPFAGQIFMAELMYGGAIIRANVEKINGVYQGACFPFWGKGLLGPVTLAFDPNGPLYVGGITEPGWMSMPDRGALFRIDYTGQAPFEMQSIHVRPNGFRIRFTQPVDPRTAADPQSYRIEHYRYEYTGAYGSPELDRTNVRIEKVIVAKDGQSAALVLPALVTDRVYRITAAGVRSQNGAALVHPTGAYTLNEVPKE